MSDPSRSAAAPTFPSSARVVVIGGGAMGSSTAYHLAREGLDDVVVLERAKLTSGTTWHAAGLVRQLRPSASLTRLIRYGTELYASLEAETGQATGWLQLGSVSVATHPDRLSFLSRQASLASVFGIEMHVVGPETVRDLWPLARTDDVIGAIWSPTDGRVNPSDLAAAYVKGARAKGVRFFEDTPVIGFEKSSGGLGGRSERITAVVTERGRIQCEAVAICSGLWSRDLARLAGAHAPLHACEHFYLLTQPMPEIVGHLPTLGDQEGFLYVRDEVGGLMVGCFEPNARALPIERLPRDFCFDLLDEDWDHFQPMLENAIHRIPALERAGAKMLLNGPESFTLDNQFLLGECPGTPGLFVGCGMNSVGIASSGGAGRALAEWILAGEPTMDLSDVDVRRFAPFQDNLRALAERIPEVLGEHYVLAYPGRQPATVRGVRRSPVHSHLVARGAHLGTSAGWERAQWFAPPGLDTPIEYSFSRPSWFERVAEEHRAARDTVAIIDQSSFGKILVQGADAEQFLDRLCANAISVAPGRVVYTAMLNRHGGIESDVTVHRLDADRFLIVTGSGALVKDMDWLERHRDAADHVALTDVTSGIAVLSVAGPRSEALLARLCPERLDAAALGYYRWCEIELGYALVRAARLSYTGENGFELYMPTEFAAGVYESLVEAGADLGLRDAGTQALESLRIEKGFRAVGHELSCDVTPWEAGLGFVVRVDGATPFEGRDALLRQRDTGLARRLVGLVIDDGDAWPLGNEPLRHGDEVVGQLTSAAYGHSVGRPIALAFVERDGPTVEAMIAAGGFAVEIAGERYPARAGLEAPLELAGRSG